MNPLDMFTDMEKSWFVESYLKVLQIYYCNQPLLLFD